MSDPTFTEHAHKHGVTARNADPSNNGADANAQHPNANAVLTGLLGGTVEVHRTVVYREGRKARYVFTVRAKNHDGPPADTRALDSEDVLTLPKLQGAIHAVTQEVIKAPKRNTEPWRLIQAAIKDAAEIIDEADEERAEWRWRIEHYVGDRLGMGRDEAARDGEPFEEDGRVYVSSPRLRAYIDKVLGEKVDKGETHAGLRDQGYEPKRVGHENVRYWRSPAGWQR